MSRSRRLRWSLAGLVVGSALIVAGFFTEPSSTLMIGARVFLWFLGSGILVDSVKDLYGMARPRSANRG